MNGIHFLKIIRWQNIIIIWLMQTVVYFQYVLPFCDRNQIFLSSFLLILGTTGSIAGFGNIYNDIQDIKTDAFHPNKPGLVDKEISVATAWNWTYWITGLSLLFILTGWLFYQWSYGLVSICISGIILLYLYSRYFKSTLLLGNFLVAFLCALSVYMTTLLVPDCNFYFEISKTRRIPLILMGYIANAFIITTLREIIKDKEDASADIKAGIYTIGSIRNSLFRMLFNGLVFVALLMNIIWFMLLYPLIALQEWILGIVIIFLPLGIIVWNFNSNHDKNTFSFLSKSIKVYILLAILLLIIWHP